MSKSTDLRDQIVNDLIKTMEGGDIPWRDPLLARAGLPKRSTGERYKGINVLILMSQARKKGYDNGNWMTFKQAKTLGGSVRKGEKSSPVFYYGQGVSQDDDGNERGYKFLKSYRVFSASQIDGLPSKFDAVKAPRDNSPDDIARAAVADYLSSSAVIEQGGPGRACYSPSDDKIIIAGPGDFKSERDFAATLSHELTHWTGHRTRLDRDQRGGFGTPAYAYEELVAEIGASMFSAHYGILGDHIENHAAYLQSWIKALKKDPAQLFKAAAAAELAFDYIQKDIAAAAPQRLAA